MTLARKTGVLTFHRCINYGSYWQAHCLVAGLRARGHDAVLLDHRSRRVDGAEWKCALQPIMSAPKRDRALYAVKMLRFFRAFSSLPLSPAFSLENPETMDSYDLVVAGSDEVWSLHHPWYGRCALFYGEHVRARRLVSYAASFGNHSVWDGLETEWADRLRRFESISVRDENSWWMIKHFVGLEPTLVLDPCLQFPPRLAGSWRGPEDPFVAVYGHSFTPTFAEQIQRWARARRLPLVSIGYRNSWADAHWITAGPLDFAHFMARAEAVVTNFFHGCVFALHNTRPFVCEPSWYRSIKVRDLMALVGGERHLVTGDTPAATFDTLLDTPLDPEISGRIAGLRHTSDAYLDSTTGTRRHLDPKRPSQETAPIVRAA
jgi:hypothetical protein